MTVPNPVLELAVEWTTSREKLMSEWLKSLRSAKTTGNELWEHTLDQIQSTVEEALSTQEKALRDWAGQLSGVEGTSDDLKKRVDEGVSLFTKWNEHQATVWRQWLETLRKSDLSLQNMIPAERYYALNEALTRLRGGPYTMQIKGTDELRVTHDSVMLEAANASFQVHFQTSPEEFPRLYNIALAVSAPV
ncbi:MAG: hypothetical protein P8Y25_11485, partial [Chromatiaceae bacterium]